MERSDFYLNSCLWMMGILNLIMVLFLAGTITLTQYRIAFAQNARSFLSQLAVMPEQPQIRMLTVVGCCLLLTAALLAFSYYYKPRQKARISMRDAFIIGVAQACAVLPGLSRSGSTIATGLLLGNDKSKLAQFSFLMVIPPILGQALLDCIKVAQGENVVGDLSTLSLVVGFLAAFVSGCLACKWMINIVKKGKLIYFAIYCAIAGTFTLIFG